MRGRNLKKILVAWSVLSLVLSPLDGVLRVQKAFAATPAILNHQGRLLNSDGDLLGGAGTNYCFRFSLYDNSVINTGSRLWPSSTPSTMTVEVSNGVFNVGIGDVSAGGDTLDFDFNSTSAYLNVEVAESVSGSCAAVSSFDTLSPRQRLVSAGYAVNSETVDGFSASQSATGNQIPALTSGNLILGATNPQINATGSNALILQSGATGAVQFFSSSNSLSSAGVLTLAGSTLTAPGSGLDVSSAGALTIANATATSLSVCNSTACDLITLGTNADADTITIGDATNDTLTLNGATVAIESADWDISATGVITGASFDANGTGNSISNIDNADLTNSSVTVTAGTGLTDGGAVSLGGSTTVNVVSANGAIVANADSIALTFVTSTDALSATTSSGSGLEILSSGASLLQGCANNEILKWSETSDVWACAADSSGGSASLDDAYNNGATVAVDAYDLLFNLTDATNDYGLVFDNTSTGTIASALRVATSGSGAAFTTAFDLSDADIATAVALGSNDVTVGGVTLSASELALLDSGVTMAELTDSGTLTVTVVDINGGAIDGTAIGANSASTGAFTTLSSTGVSAIGNNGATVVINSSDWDIDATGAITGVAFDANGSGNSISNIDNADLTNSSLTVTAGSGLTGGGVVSLGGSVALQAALGTSIDTAEVDADTLTLVDIANSQTFDADLTLASSNSTSDFKFILDNSSTGDVATLFSISTTGSGATVGTALDLSDADIATSIALGLNDITVNGATISAAEFSLLDGGVALSELTDSGTLTAGTVDINGGAIDGTAIGANSASTGAFTTLGTTGVTSIGNNSATVAVNSSDWDIDATGAITGISFDANGSGNSITNIDNADLTNSSLTVTAGSGLTGGGVVALGGSVSLQAALGTSIDTSEVDADTLTLGDLANTQTFDADLTLASSNATSDFKFILDNSSTGDVATLFLISTTGSGATVGTALDLSDADIATSIALGLNDITVNGATISAAEFALLDSGVALSELTDSGTLTAGTVDINGGAIDGTAIGANSASTGAFTTLGTTGVTTIGNNSATVAVNSSDWDIDATGAITGASFDANGSGNSISNIDNADLTNDTLDFDKMVDAGALDAAWSVTGTAGETITFVRSLTDATAENALTVNATASDAGSSTSSQFGLYLDNLASTEGLDASLVIDNSDADDVIGAAIKIVNAGGGFTTIIDNAGTLISGAELNVLDSGIALSELTDSGTLTAGTVDINGGAIDGTAIGANSASTGAFTTLGTTGVTTIGNNSATVAVNSSDWDIDATGAITGISLDANGSGNSITNIDNADLTNSSLTVTAGSGLTGGGVVALGGSVSLQAALGTSIDTSEVDADTLTLADLANTQTFDADLTLASSNATNDFKFIIDNSSTGDVATLFSISTSGSGATVGTALDLSDADIATSIALGLNDITVNGATISAAEFSLLDGGIALSELTDSGTLTAGTVDINGGAIDGTAIGANSASTGAFTTLSSTGVTTIGNNSATVAVNSSDWDIDATGAITGVAFDANGSGNSITNIENGDFANDTLDFDKFVDALAFDSATSFTGTAGETFTIARTLTDAAAENGAVFNFTASDAGSSTSSQFGLYLDNLASTEGLDASFVIDNSDADDVIGAAIKIVNAGGGFTNIIDNAGTLISGAEINVLDGGIAFSELTDSGTLTVTTVDINGGAIDGTAIGANSASTGAFTTLGTTGVTTIGNNSATVAVNSSDWDIDATGAITGVAFDANGTGNSITNIDNADLANSSVTVTAGSGLANGGSVSLGGNTTLNVASGNGGIVVGADSLALTLAVSANGLSATTSSGSGLEILSTGASLLQGCADNEILKWDEGTDVWACDTDVTGGGSGSLDDAYNNGGVIALDAYDVLFNLSDATNDYKLTIDNATNGTIATGLAFTTTGGGTSILTTAIDLSDADIITALALGSNDVTVGGVTLSASELALLDSGIALSELTDSGTLTAGTVDINGGAIDGTAIGANSASTGAFTTLGTTGATTIGNNSATVAINSNDWDIDVTGAITGVTFDANGSGNSISNIDNADLTNSSLTVTAGSGLTGGGVVSLGGSVSLQAALGTSIDTSEVDADTLTLADLANTQTFDADLTLASSNATNDFKFILDNSSTGDVATLFSISTTGSGATVGTALDLSDADIATSIALGLNDITVNGATISAAEFALLDSGVALSELSDSGTLTAGTVDINGGAIDGTAIGANSASTGAFTTLSSTGVSTIGNNSATVAVNSSDWDIDATGAITGVALDANGSGNSITNIENADLANDTIDFDKMVDAGALDTTWSVTGTAGETITFVRSLTDATAESALTVNATASDAGSSTSSQFGLYLDNLASTEGLDASLVIDNSDADDVIGAAIKIVNAGGGFTTIIDNAGTLISGTELNVLDSGIAFSELTDSGTLTATTVDINGGAIDGTAIGANSASTGAFTTLGTTGVTTIGNNSATVAVNSSDWDIDATGAITGAAFDANGSGNSISNIENADLVNDTLDFDKFVDALSFDAATSFTGTAGETFTIARTLTDAAAENGAVINFTASDAGSSTSSQFGLYLDNLASTEGLDASLVIDNSDADDVIGAAIKIVNAGGGFTNIIDNAGTLISGAEINLLDSGIALSELTDSGTLTAGTVDINGGAIDGTAIGANSASTGAFTTLGTTGVTTIGNNSATVAVNSSDWDIDATGAITGVALDANGSGNSISNIDNADLTNDTLDFDKMVDSGALDTTWSVTGTAGETITFVRSLTDATAENALTVNATASDAGGSTSSQFGLYLDNLASTEGLDASLVIDNSDADDAVAAAIKIVNAGGGFTTLIDNAGTLISGAEFNLIDSGIALSELTDSGTLTAGTVDINGGAIDGTAIGANSASTGAFTTLGTTGVTTIGNNSATVAVNSSDWDIDATGAITGVAFDANGTGNSITNIENGDFANDTLDFDKFVDALAFDSATSFTGTAGETFTIARTLTDAAAENGAVFNFTASDAGSSTSSQFGLYLDNLSSTEGLDASFVIDNSDADDVIGAAIKIVNAGGGFTNIIDNAGTLISGAEINLLDSGIALSELTDSGTLTAGTVDINGGAIDGTAIGANSASTGAFTTLGTTGVTTIGNNSATVAVNSSDWDIDATGAITGVAFDANGSGNSLSNVDNADLTNSSVTVTAGSGLADGGSVSLGGSATLNVASANGGIVVNADNVALTVAPSANGLSATTSTGSGLEILATGLALLQGCGDNEILKWDEGSDVWACDTDLTGGGGSSLDDAYNTGATLTVDAYDVLFNLSDATNDYKLTIDNATNGTITTGLAFTTAGGGSSVFTTAIDLSDADIVAALALGSNDVTVGGVTLSASELALLDSGIALSELTDSGTLTAGTVDINGGAIDGAAIGANSASTGAFTTLGTTGVTTIGNNSATVAVNSSDWDIDATGAITGVALDANGSGNSLSNVDNADLTNDTLDFDKMVDAGALDTTWSVTGTAGETITFVRALTDATAENALTVNATASDAGGSTSSQFGLYLDNLASTEGLDASIVIDNSDADDAVGAAIKIVDAGGGFTNIIDNAGTLISGAEINILDSGIALSELTDSGTLTVTTVDINGGAIDGAAIGANSASTGAFTTLGTTGVTTIGNNSATVAVNSSDWDIDATGAITGVALDANGSGNSLSNIDNADLTNDTLDFDKMVDAGALDTVWSVTGTAGETITFARALTNDTSENGFTVNVTASDTGSGTTDQYGLYLDNLASTEGLDAALVIDNSDADDVIGAAVKIVNAGGGFTTIIDNAGTLISGTELNILDGGLAYSELTDSGTLTVTTVDINGGAIDGTTIGATSASTGAFTTLGTTGVTTIGNNSATVAINSSDWDIDATGAITNISLDANGTGNSITNIETGDIADATLTGDDLATSIAGNGLVLTAGSPDQLDLDLLAISDGTGSTSSFSGMEFSGAGSDKIALLQGCADGEILEYTDASGWACGVDDGGVGGSTLQAAYDAGATILMDATGDVTFQTIAGTQFHIDGSVAPTVDLMSIENTGQGTITTAVDGLQISFVTAATAGSIDNAGIRIALDPAGATEAGDTVEAIDIAGITNPTGVTTGIRIGQGFDRGIQFQDDDSSAYVAFKAPSAVTGSVTWTLPTADSAGCFASDGSGTMSITACGNVNYQTFTSNTTYTKPTNAKSIIVETIGGGGSGGGGQGAAAATLRLGGSGGGGGAYITKTFDGANFTSSAVNVTAPGVVAGGASSTNGGIGGTACLSATATCGGTVYVQAGGGGAGIGAAGTGRGGGGGGGAANSGANGASNVGGAGGGPNGGAAGAAAAQPYGGGGGGTGAATGGNGSFSTSGGGGGGGSSNAATSAGAGGKSIWGGGGGGAGGGVTAANAVIGGGAGGQSGGNLAANMIAGGGGGTGGAAAGAGNAGNNANGVGTAGNGGGGGGANNTAAGVGGAGGNGGNPGGGGGGGGASITGGAGGAGGRAEVRIVTLSGGGAGGADLGEFYSTNDLDIQAADIASLDSDLDAGVKKSSIPYDPNVMGVISTKADIVMGAGMATGGAQTVVLGLAGRVPVKVTAMNGPIKAGDYITSSSLPGIGMKATKAGNVVGQALTGWDPAVDDPTVAPDRMGVVIMFIQKGYYNGEGLADLMAVEGIQVEADPNLKQVTFGEQVLGKFMTAQVDPADLDEDALHVSELLTDRVAAAIEIITPQVTTHGLSVDVMRASTGSGIEMALEDGGVFSVTGPVIDTVSSEAPAEGQVDELEAATREVITFDYLGNAYFAGTVTATSISADTITGLDIFAERIAVLSDAVEGLSSEDETVTAADLVSVRDMVAVVSSYTASLAGQTAGSDAALIARLDTDAAAQLLINNTFIDGLAALDLRVMAAEAALLADTALLTDLEARLLAAEDQLGLNLATLDLTGDLSVQGLATFSGGIMVDSIGSIGSATSFLSDQIFIGRPYFNEDTGGFAVVRAGDSEVRVNFTEAYLTQPVVQSSVAFDALDESIITDEAERQNLLADLAAAEAAYLAGDIRYVITQKSTTGFTIVLNQPATTDLRFSWIALAVNNAGLDESVTPAPVVQEPSIQPEPVIEDPYDFTTPDNLNPDYAPLEDNVPLETVPETIPEPVAEEPVTAPEVVPTEPEFVTPISEEQGPIEPTPEPAVEAAPVETAGL